VRPAVSVYKICRNVKTSLKSKGLTKPTTETDVVPNSNTARNANLENSMSDRALVTDGIEFPEFFYGTAWKEDQTKRLTELAVRCGFRAIDTANQRRHYHESAVGQAVSGLIAHGVVGREDLFLQTKFTFQRGQDHRLPYDPGASIPVQVEQSFASSLKHLGVERVDSYLLHGPAGSTGLTSDDWAAWRAMEAIHNSGRARWIGVSNVTLEQLKCFCQDAQVQPRTVQNRCYAVRGWDHDIRDFCRANGLAYQAFSLLTANRESLASPEFTKIAARHARTTSQIAFRFAMDAGMIPLTGTTNVDHMRADLDIFKFRLHPAEIEQIEHIRRTIA
jgi:diketogulonate reductase-like aldo/keto reductase